MNAVVNCQLLKTAVAKPVGCGLYAPPARPCTILIDGVEFHSDIPQHDGESVHINEIARRLFGN